MIILKNVLKKINQRLSLFGINPKKFIKCVWGVFFFLKDLHLIKKQKGSNIEFEIQKMYPMLDERFKTSGTMSGHYFHQDLYVARQIFFNKPKRHIDIGSRTDGFVAHVAVFREIEIIDIRS